MEQEGYSLEDVFLKLTEGIQPGKKQKK